MNKNNQRIVSALILWVMIETCITYSTPSNFKYTLCRWNNSRCLPTDPLDITQYMDREESKWPSGPYALLTPSVGCPESGAKGWRLGYISLTWKRPHILTSLMDCLDMSDNSRTQFDETNITETTNRTHIHRCRYSLTSNEWPNPRSVLLGPFGEYEWTMNVCYKIKNNLEFDDTHQWPIGSYSIFGDDIGCPGGFESTETKVNLPAITSWTSDGHLPGFTVTKETDDSVTLSLKMCDRRAADNGTNVSDNFPVHTTDSFILIKNKAESSCPDIEYTYVEAETIQLCKEIINCTDKTELFDLCFYTPKRLSLDLDDYLYYPQNTMLVPYEPEFSILNPTLIYGNVSSTTRNNLQQDGFNTHILPQINQRAVTPWLIVDFGRNHIVIGLMFEKNFLGYIKSTQYLGRMNKTRHGFICQRWDTQIPNAHGMTKDDMFPDTTISDAENYCRDPDNNGYLWCYADSHSLRWEECSSGVYEFKEENRPFSRCFISEDRWRIEQHAGISCTYTVSYDDVDGQLYFSFKKNMESRYIMLVGKENMDFQRFYSGISHVKVMITGNILLSDDAVMCNTDLGMGDESIVDNQISASSSVPMSPPSSSRPFHTGWCADISDKNPFITVDLMADTIVEGITVFNWEVIDKSIEDGKYQKKFFPIGSKKVLISYSADNNQSITNKSFSLNMLSPVDQPQRFFHNQIRARYVTIYIVASMTTSKCIRFELHGCKRSSRSGLVASKWSLDFFNISKDGFVTMANLQIVNDQTVINSLGYPAHYAGGMSYSWIIDFPKSSYIQLLFTEISFNTYDQNVLNQDQDRLVFHPMLEEDGMLIDRQFNGLVMLVDTDLTYLTLTFTSFMPTTIIKSSGNGFNAVVKSIEIPTCSSTRRQTDNLFHNFCNLPKMYITSLSRLNFPVSSVTEKWTIHLPKFSIHLKILYFYVRCESGSRFTVTDRFSGSTTYCNMNKIPTDWYSDSDTVIIEFEKDPNKERYSSLRITAKEGFKALYTARDKSMAQLIDKQKPHKKAIIQIASLEHYWGHEWKNATLLAYQGCSKQFGKCYYIYSGAITSWKRAGQECWIRQSRLVSIHSDEEHELIKYIVRGYRYVDIESDSIETAFQSNKTDPNYFTHIGLSHITSKAGVSRHLWEDGSQVTFSAWKDGEPSTKGKCTRMSFHLLNTNDTWETEDCETGLASYFICENYLTNSTISFSEKLMSTLYNGTLNVTLTGKSCQRWDSQYPHSHEYDKDYQFPDWSASDAENFCRDPSDDGYIWCYTADPYTRYEKCSEDVDDNSPSMYVGKLRRTSSGRTCQRWDELVPHYHPYVTESFFPDHSVKDAANYCRDPSSEKILWCYTTDPGRRWETCNLADTAEDRCYSTHSVYSGKVNKTRSGAICQPWDSQAPHEHEIFSDSQFPERSVFDASNYCRDPNNDGYLWCFTTDPAIRTEPCLFDYKYQLLNYTTQSVYNNETTLCRNEEMIPKISVCDGKPDCRDLSDEVRCTINEHPLMRNRTYKPGIVNLTEMYSLFQCENKEIISMLVLCDDVIDCIDATDEMNCSVSNVSKEHNECSEGKFTCKDGSCIHVSQMCDFVDDCIDASDENCDYPLCSKQEFRCRNQQCIPIENRCDAYEHCLDGTDEAYCDVCKESSFHCDLVRCIPKRLVCDNYIDCRDESDEASCDQPIYTSCEDWWKAGFRKSGIYDLNNTQAKCNFDDVYEEGTIYTVFHNYEVTLSSGSLAERNPSYTEEIIYLQEEGNDMLPQSIVTHFMNNSYSCFQNITQSYVPAFKVLSNYLTPNKNDNTETCINMEVVPYNSSVNRYWYQKTNIGLLLLTMSRFFGTHVMDKMKYSASLTSLKLRMVFLPLVISMRCYAVILFSYLSCPLCLWILQELVPLSVVSVCSCVCVLVLSRAVSHCSLVVCLCLFKMCYLLMLILFCVCV